MSDMKRYPLTQQQQQYVAGAVDLATAADWNVAQAWLVSGHLDIDRLGRAVAGVVCEHEGLRTTFHLRGESIGLVHNYMEHEVVLLERSDRDPLQALEREAARPFALETGPMFRLVIQPSKDDTYVLFAYQQVVADGTAGDLLADSIWTTYDELVRGVPLDPRKQMGSRFEFSQYAETEHQRLIDGGFDGDLAYWKRTLRGLSLANSGSRMPKPTAGSRYDELEHPVALNAGARLGSHSPTPFIAGVAAFASALSQQFALEEVLIRTIVDTRPTLGYAGVVGNFSNTILLRLDMAERNDRAAFAEHALTVVLGALEHSNVPYRRVIEANDVPEAVDGFDAIPFKMVGYQSGLTQSRILPCGLCLTLQELRSRGGVFTPLGLYLTTSEAGPIRAAIAYGKDLLESSMINELGESLVREFEAVQ